MSTASKDKRRTRKRRARSTEAEMKAFRFGAKVARDAIGPEIWKRAAIRAGSIGFAVGCGVGGAIAYYFG